MVVKAILFLSIILNSFIGFFYCNNTDIVTLMNEKPLIWDEGNWDEEFWNP